MALANLTVPAFPDVPNVMGVPALIRRAQPVLDAIGYASSIDNKINRLLSPPVEETWGVFDDAGVKVLTPETFIGLEFRQESNVLEHPIEEGSFSTYNKVDSSFDASIVMATGGTNSDRAALLQQVEILIASLALYTIVTPEVTYESVTLCGYGFSRQQSNGSHQIVVSLRFKEIRETALVNADTSGEISSDPALVATPDAAPSRSLGQVAAQAITDAQAAALAGAARVLASVKGAFQ